MAARSDTSDPPTTTEYNRRGEWSAPLLARRFGSWRAAAAAAGLDDAAVADRFDGGGRPKIDPDALRADLRRVAARDDTSDPPTQGDYRRLGDHSPGPLADHFGSWPAALDAAGLDGDAARERAPGWAQCGDPAATDAGPTADAGGDHDGSDGGGDGGGGDGGGGE